MSAHLAHILPSAKPSMIHWVYSPSWKKVKKLGVIHSTWQLIASSPLTQVPYVPKSLPRALRNIRQCVEYKLRR